MNELDNRQLIELQAMRKHQEIKMTQHWTGQPNEPYLPPEGATTPHIRDLILEYICANGRVTSPSIIAHIERQIRGPKPLRAGVHALVDVLCEEGLVRFYGNMYSLK